MGSSALREIVETTARYRRKVYDVDAVLLDVSARVEAARDAHSREPGQPHKSFDKTSATLDALVAACEAFEQRSA